MDKINLNNRIQLLVKTALEYNASIIAVASLTFGTVKDKRSYEASRRSFVELGKDYEKKMAEIMTENTDGK